MTSEVFRLEEPDRRIIKYLAIKGALNLNQIEKHTSNYGYHLKRWAIKNRIYGSPKFLGLIRHNFVVVTLENKHRYGKQEKKYHLTLKGILASCSNVRLEENYYVKEYIHNIVNKTKCPKLNSLVSQYIFEHIKLLIGWYFVNGFQLQKGMTSGYNDQEILLDFYHLGSFSFFTTDSELTNYLKTIFKKCVKLNTIIHLLGGTYMHSELSLARMQDLNKMKGDVNVIHFPWPYLREWPLYLGNRSPELKKYTSKQEFETTDFDSKKIKQEITTDLKKLGFSVQW